MRQIPLVHVEEIPEYDFGPRGGDGLGQLTIAFGLATQRIEIGVQGVVAWRQQSGFLLDLCDGVQRSSVALLKETDVEGSDTGTGLG